MRRLPPGLVLFAVVAPILAEEPASLRYRIQAAGSDLRWELPATLHTVHGVAPEVTGTVDAEPGPGGEWKVSSRIVAQAASMVTGNSSRDRTMREKVLETDRFPEIVFEARRVVGDLSRFKKAERFTVEVTGDLTVHGKALSVRLPVDVFVLPEHVLLSGSFPLNWRQYGLSDPSFGIVKVREPLKVLFRLDAVPASAKP